jgi:uncharacterized protein YbjT (DUF2867 family)
MSTPTPTNQRDRTTLVTSGGKTGRRVAARLEQLDRPVRIASRSTQPPFDWNDDTTWAAALDGVDAAYLAFVPEIAFPGADEIVAAFARTAVERGARRLILLSGRGGEGAVSAEQLVRATGADLTVVRSSFFAQNFDEGAFVDAVREGALALHAGDVVEPFVDLEDLADVITAALVDDRHIGETYDVTGPELLTFGQAVDAIAAASGRDVQYVAVTADEFLAGARAAGVPEEEAVGLMEVFSAVLDGRNASLGDGVQRALGREPHSFASYASRVAATGVWNEAEAA